MPPLVYGQHTMPGLVEQNGRFLPRQRIAGQPMQQDKRPFLSRPFTNT
jgi:hypothetical protein